MVHDALTLTRISYLVRSAGAKIPATTANPSRGDPYSGEEVLEPLPAKWRQSTLKRLVSSLAFLKA